MMICGERERETRGRSVDCVDVLPVLVVNVFGKISYCLGKALELLF